MILFEPKVYPISLYYSLTELLSESSHTCMAAPPALISLLPFRSPTIHYTAIHVPFQNTNQISSFPYLKPFNDSSIFHCISAKTVSSLGLQESASVVIMLSPDIFFSFFVTQMPDWSLIAQYPFQIQLSGITLNQPQLNEEATHLFPLRLLFLRDLG